MADTRSQEPGNGAGNDRINRGNYRQSLGGNLVWVGYRAIDPFFQYQLLAKGWGTALLSRLGMGIAPGAAGPLAQIGGSTTSLAPGAATRSSLLTMFIIGAGKHIYWKLALQGEYFPASQAFIVGSTNLIMDSLASIWLLWTQTSTTLGPQVSIPLTSYTVPLQMLIGGAMFLVGASVETISEIQRKRFKKNPANKGKIIRSGLWKLARHINYGGYLLWRSGVWFASGSFGASIFLAGFLLYDFSNVSIKGMDAYMTKKYGDQWIEYKEEVPYLIIPGLV